MNLPPISQLFKGKIENILYQLISVCLLFSNVQAEPFFSSFISYHNRISEPPSGIEPTSVWEYPNLRYSSSDKKWTNLDFVVAEPGKVITLATIKGPAEVTHIWFTWNGEEFLSRFLTLEIYWDDSPTPAVSVPLGDFFLQPHGRPREIVSLPFVNTNIGEGRNCYFRMPFRHRAVFTVRNDGSRPAMVYFHIDYHRLKSLPEPLYYFHAKYNQQFPTDGWFSAQDSDKEIDAYFKPILTTQNRNPEGNYVILSTRGTGYYVGCMLAVHTRSKAWWGEGDDMIFIDDSTTPTLLGTGTEDYFGNAWGLQTKQTPLFGVIQYEPQIKNGESAVYRFHLEDPIRFNKSIRVTVEHGHNNSRSDDYCSVAYWYQKEPGDTFGYLPRQKEARMTPIMRARDNFLQQLKKSCQLEADNKIGEAITVTKALIQRYENYREVSEDAKLRLAFLYIIAGEQDKAKELLSRLYNLSSRRKFRKLVADLLYVLESPDNALLFINGDDYYTVYLDGEKLTEGTLYDDFKHIRLRLSPGEHTVLVECKNILLFGGVCVEIVSMNGTLISDEEWLITSPPEKIDRKWYLHPEEIGGWRKATEYYRPWEVLFWTRNFSFFSALGLQAKWLWSEKNYVNYDEYYFRCDFVYRGFLWRRKLRYLAQLTNTLSYPLQLLPVR